MDITVKPLRKVSEDIQPVAEFYLAQYAEEHHEPPKRLDASAVKTLKRHDWPGNIRELENVMERAVILTGDSPVLNLTPETLLNFTTSSMPSAICVTEPPPAPAAPAVPPTDRDAIIAALRATGGQIGGKSGAAAMLGLKRTTLLARLKKLGIDADAFRDKPDTEPAIAG